MVSPSSVNVNFNAKNVCRINQNVYDAFQKCDSQKNPTYHGQSQFAYAFNRLSIGDGSDPYFKKGDTGYSYKHLNSKTDPVLPYVRNTAGSYDMCYRRNSRAPTDFNEPTNVADDNFVNCLFKSNPLDKLPCNYGMNRAAPPICYYSASYYVPLAPSNRYESIYYPNNKVAYFMTPFLNLSFPGVFQGALQWLKWTFFQQNFIIIVRNLINLRFFLYPNACGWFGIDVVF